MVRSTPRLDGRRYLAALRAPTDVPTLQLHGAEDRCLPASSAELLADEAAWAGPHHRFELVPRAGHFLPEEAPGRVTTLLRRWLADVAPV
jgi:pimeloyl-ACP methyl ester carboxylesterase